MFSESGPAPLVLAPWLDPTLDARSHAIRSEVTLSSQMPRLPSKVVFIVDSNKLATASAHQMLFSSTLRGEESGTRFSSLGKLREGFVAGEIEVLSWTNNGKLNLPLTFKATQRAFPESGIDGGFVFAEYLGRVDSVKTVPPRSSYVPDISQWEIAVADFRLYDRKSGVDYINHRVKSGTWPYVVNEELLAVFEQRKAALNRHFQKPAVGRIWVLALLFLVLISPAIRPILRRLNHPKQK